MILRSQNEFTLQEFLKLPPGEGDNTYELVDGQIITKMSPKKYHSRLTHALLYLIQSCEGRGYYANPSKTRLGTNTRPFIYF